MTLFQLVLVATINRLLALYTTEIRANTIDCNALAELLCLNTTYEVSARVVCSLYSDCNVYNNHNACKVC